MKISNIVKTIALTFGIALSIFAINFVVLAWVGPPGDPTYCPSGHIGCDIPLHEGTAPQIKGAAGVGALGIEGVLRAYSNLIVDGNVGIGTTSPGAKLDVAGTARMTGFQLGTSATAGHVLTTNASGVGTWQAAPSAPVTSVFGRTGAVTAQVGDYSTHYVNRAGDTMTGNLWFSGGTRYIGTSDNNEFRIRTNNTDRMIIQAGGNVGIGVAPSAKLHVAGTGKFTGALDMTDQKIINLATPTAASDSATKAYVDAQAGGGSSCPSEIESSDRSSATLANAITTCRNRGGDWRLPTAEEISCFIGASGVSSSHLWTRSPHYGNSFYWVRVRLTDGGWSGSHYSNTRPFRCVR